MVPTDLWSTLVGMLTVLPFLSIFWAIKTMTVKQSNEVTSS